ncbi:MAG: hypothetical protein HY300_15675 [Verrucomicrobia bacterium]|nr:hypothetical protein [Verrucomicrobiota bacterium]
MKQLFTPLLKRVYAAFLVIVAVYFAAPPVLHSEWNKDRLYRKLLAGDRKEKLDAAADLIAYGGQEQLLRALKSDSVSVREVALGALFDLWSNYAGEEPARLLQVAMTAHEQQNYRTAYSTLNYLTHHYPFFAEGWSHRASLLSQFGLYERAIADCRKVILLNPVHFSAWQGMGFCQMRVGDIDGAVHSLRAALRLAPHDRATQRILRQCEQLQRRMRNSPETRGEEV